VAELHLRFKQREGITALQSSNQPTNIITNRANVYRKSIFLLDVVLCQEYDRGSSLKRRLTRADATAPLGAVWDESAVRIPLVENGGFTNHSFCETNPPFVSEMLSVSI
jgi:hypothetical protein